CVLDVDITYPGAFRPGADRMAARLRTAYVAVAQYLLAIHLQDDMAQVVGQKIGFEAVGLPRPVFGCLWRGDSGRGERRGDTVGITGHGKRAPPAADLSRM